LRDNLKKVTVTFFREEQVRSVPVTALVDTGTMTLVISEELRLQLGLGIVGFRNIALINYKTETARVTEPVEVHWKDRYFG
jgi:predicted aspartyl protease